MKIDSALKVFSESYDRDAIQSIQNISEDFGLIIQKSTIKSFNLNEAFDEFQDFLTKYGKYKVENVNNEKATPQAMICERVETNIREELFKESKMLYNEIPAFIESYISGINNLTATMDSVKQKMYESGVDADSIGDVNKFVDGFIERLDESFKPTMDRLLWASGYNSRKALSKSNHKPETAAVFL